MSDFIEVNDLYFLQFKPLYMQRIWGGDLLQKTLARQDMPQLDENAEPILCFDFKGMEAHGFSLMTEENLPCFFFCLDITQTGENKLPTVLLRAASNKDLQSLLDFVEEHLTF